MGNRLQYVDSTIAETVLLAFAKEGIPVLPLHDSFRIDARYFPDLDKEMTLVILKKYGKLIDISNDDFKPLLQRTFETIKDKLKRNELSETEVEDLIKIVEDLERPKNRKHT